MRYGNLLIEGKVTTHDSATTGVSGDDLLFEMGSATVGNANGGSISFKPGAGFGTGVAGSVKIESAATLKFMDSDSSNFVGFKAASALGGDTVYTLPTADGTSGQVLKTDGSGSLAWTSVATDVYVTIAGDTGTATADVLNDTIKFAGGVGINTVAVDGSPDTVTISFGNHLMSHKATPLAADQFVLFDSASSNAPVYTNISELLSTFNVAHNISTNGFVVRTNNDTFTSRSIVASTSAGLEGVYVTDGDGVTGDPTIGLNINGLTAGTVGGSTELAAYDGTNNVKVTPSQIVESRIARGTFGNSDLTAGALAIAHNLNVASVLVQIFDESNQMVLPDTLTLTNNNTTTADLSSYGTISGTWSYIVFG